MVRRLCVFVLLLAAFALPGRAQDRLLSPAEFLGYALGERFTPHHRVVDYVEHVAAHAPAVRLEPYGETNEGRPLLTAVVASAENMARLEQIRTDNLRRAGLLEGAPEGPPVALVWLSYNVHGNESVSTEAAMATLYDLANPEDARTQGWLANTVVVLDPCINPDGRDRYVHWYNRTVGEQPNPNPDAREHHEPWPGGRTNHYYFDLNRDWAWGTQLETRQRLALYNRWLPHVHVDFHEQGVDAPYFFAPAAEPFHEAITPWQRELQTLIGQNHTRYFDREGWLYFTRQVFDLFYPGYGDTWPTFNGAVGMTYEQGGSGRAGLAIRTAEGDTLTLAERIAHHHTTGLSTVETAAANHARIVDEFAAYHAAAQAADGSPYRAFVVKGTNADRRAALAHHLEQQGIRYGLATTRQSARGLAYATGEAGAFTVEPGDLVVPAAQPKGVLARVLFDPAPVLSDSLSYDVTAWALPYVYGVEAYAATEAVTAGSPALPTPDATPAAPARPYAYVAGWDGFADAQLLAAALREGITARYAEYPFEIDGQTFGAGTLLFTRTGNAALGAAFDARLRALAAEHGQTLRPVATGFVTRGADFGSSDVHFIDAPKVAVLAGESISSYAAGEVWHYFDQQLRYPVTLLYPDDFGGIDLDDYDVLVLPSGSYGRILSEERLGEVRAWVRGGGRLVALERAAAYLAGKDGFALKEKDADEEEGSDEDDADEDRLRRYADRDRAAISGAVTGAVYRVRLDETHPLAFGLGSHYYTLRRTDDAFAFLDDGWNVGVLRDGTPLSGFAGAEAQQQIDDTLVFGVQPMGRGAVVYLLDDPLFRGFWYAGRLLFANAVFMR
ncbi:MAG: M14 family metallopeptidase [Rhodothermales bacterium]|nr:M14 family metallopeptidase [Rhodothermales bacterium]